jgi:uncharacterized protein (TIGR02145 family)
MPNNPTAALALACTLLFVACEKKNEQQKDTFTDTRDGKIYKTVKIGEQVWLAENLNYEAEGECFINDQANCHKYGRLYDWYTALNICPKSWHLPSNEEWQTLVDFAGGKEIAGKNLKTKNGWYPSYTEKPGKYVAGNGKNIYGFSALPGGGSAPEGFYDGNYGVGYEGIWWSSTEQPRYHFRYYFMSNESNKVGIGTGNMSNIFSVRCVQD